MWGLREWIDFRCADEDSIQAVRKYVLRKGGLISVNHPKCVGPPWLFRGWDGYPAMEVWQAPWRFHNWESLERWDALLRKGERVVAVGGSDVHSIPPAEPRHPHGLANPTTWVYAEPNRGSRVLDAIRAGHVYLTDAPTDTQLILTADTDGDGRFETLMGDTIAPPQTAAPSASASRSAAAWTAASGSSPTAPPSTSARSTKSRPRTTSRSTSPATATSAPNSAAPAAAPSAAKWSGR